MAAPSAPLLPWAEEHPRIDFEVTFHFAGETWIGDPWDIPPNKRMTERRRSQNDGRWKLQALFPLAIDSPVLDKNAAFDVCRSRNEETTFQRWDDIRHNIILNWIDLVETNHHVGCALFSGHTTAYCFGPGRPLGLVLGWGWEGGFWWGKCPLLDDQQASYSLLPHTGTWEEALLPQQQQALEEPLTAQFLDGPPPLPARKSLLSSSHNAVQVSAAYRERDALHVRLFNARAQPSHTLLTLGFATQAAAVAELDGRVVESLALHTDSRGTCTVELTLPPFGLRTLRLASSPDLKKSKDERHEATP